ncbi:MAG: B12-binding domain-containing radical SAM protein [Euryarchaeota archaeon]|nr:B12-binding domain-containing radical SAM protein [Euryarchaeota archaeon]
MDKNGKVILIGAEDEENLAIRYLAAVLDNHTYKVKIVPCSRYNNFSDVLRVVESFDPHIVGVSIAFQTLACMFFDLIDKIKKIKPEIHVTVGGHFPTFEYRKIMETQNAIDTVIRFEGEKPILMLADAVINKKEFSNIPNLVYREVNKLKENPCIHRFPNLNDLPFPLRGKKPQIRLGEKFATLVASRGCFHSKCLYCCIGAFHAEKEGVKYALREPENVAHEMAGLYHQRKVRVFQFHDDNFLLPSKKDTLERFKSLKVALQNEDINLQKIAMLIKARPDALNEKIVSILKEIGVTGVFLGIENASKTGLKALIRGSSPKEINNSLNLLKKHEIAVTFNLLIFHPKAKLDEINENIYFMKKNSDCANNFGRAEIVAGSPLENLVMRNNLRRGQWPNWDYKIEDDAVERMFRINSLTFYRINSSYTGLSHQIIAQAYRAQIIGKFYPGKPSQKIMSETQDLVRRFNEFTLKNLIAIYKLTAELKSKEEIDNLYKKIENECQNFINDAKIISDRMWRLQILERKFGYMDLDDVIRNSKIIKQLFRI